MRDINDIMPKIPNMKWGALTNKYPTNKNVKELDKMLPHDKKWHTVFDFDDQVYVDDVQIWKKTKKLGPSFPSSQPFWVEYGIP